MADEKVLGADERCAALFSHLVLAQRVKSGAEAVLLLTSSAKVAADLFADLDPDFVEESFPSGGPPSGGSPTVQMCLRKFDERVSPSRELRAFVFDGQLTGITQSLTLVPPPFLLARKKEVREVVSAFFEKCIRAEIERGNLPRQFAMDLLIVVEGAESITEVLLVEVNPFDGEEWGVYAASTGLFDFKTTINAYGPDFDVLVGRSGSGITNESGSGTTNEVELRLRETSVSEEQMRTFFGSSNKEWADLVLCEKNKVENRRG